MCALVGHAATYVPTTADMGRALLAEVDVANAAGTAMGGTLLTAPVGPGAPTLVSAPVVSGQARVGETLGAVDPVIAGHGTTVAIALTWFACRDSALASCTISAGPGATHLIAETERGLRLRVRADASGSGGSLVTWSAPTEPVLGRNECVLVAPGTVTACVGASSPGSRSRHRSTGRASSRASRSSCAAGSPSRETSRGPTASRSCAAVVPCPPPSLPAEHSS